MADSILIIDSSDEEAAETVKPAKRIKTEHINGIKNEDETFGLKIVEVTSLAENNSNSDVIEIDSDDNENVKVSSKTKKVGENSVLNSEKDENNGDISSLSGNNTGAESSEEENVLLEKPKNDDVNKENLRAKENTEEQLSEFQNFLNICVSCLQNGKYKDLITAKLQSIKLKYSEADSEYIKSKSFSKLLSSSIEHIKIKPANAIIHFKTVYEELKSRKSQDDLVLNHKQEFYLNKLRKTMRLLDKKIKKLEEADVNFDDDNDSAYIMLDRYKRKFVAVHKKYCSYTKEDSFAGRITHRKLDFNISVHPEINRAIDKLYFKEKKFPLFNEVEDCIKKCVKEKCLNISEPALESEITKMYKEMARLVQRRRQCELEDIHMQFLGSKNDPALEDPELKKLLEEQAKKGEEKLDEVFETFTKRQAQGDDPVVSSDSDDSNIQSEQEGNEENKTNPLIILQNE